jgi:beta-glucosidase
MHRGIRRALLAGAAACALAAAAAPRTAAAASCSWMDTGQSAAQRTGELVAAMSLDDKVNLVTGSIGFGSGTINPGSAATVAGNPALCLPSLVMNDAGAGIGDLQTGTTAFPDSIGQTATWDRAAQQLLGEALGQEAFAKGVNVLLAPGMDVTRTPLNGRTFEYAGEDPYLAGESAAATIRGVQSQHVVATAKHYALNSQEVNRNTNSEDADEQTEQEIYLAPFETAVREGGAGAVMCAYNQVHGVYSCENPDLLNTILKGQFGFTGWVMSDWFGTHSTAAAANAGLDQEMPGGQFFGPALKTAVQNGDVPIARLDDMVRRIALTMFRLGLFDHVPAEGTDAANATATTPAHLATARAAADEGAVLLKDQGGVLPLAAGKKIAVIGPAADDAGAQNAYQGAGSGRVPLFGTKPDVVSPLSAITARAATDGGSVVFDKGADPQAAAAVARTADVAVVVVHNISTEGVDLPDLKLHSGSCDVFNGCTYDGTDEDALVAALAAANPHTVVVLQTAGPVTMPWLSAVPGVLETWFPGQEDGHVVSDLLFGDVNPSGKLPVTFPVTESDGPLKTPEQYPGVNNHSTYSEGIFVGYRWYDAQHVAPLFPFGYGLSYTTFAFAHETVTPRFDGSADVSFDVTNTGSRAGAEVAQVYVGPGPAVPGVQQAVRALRGYDRVGLAPGETRRETVTLDPRSFQYWNSAKHAWGTDYGQRTIWVGDSSANLPLSATAAPLASTSVTGGVGGTVPATLSLTLGAPASFGAFTPGVDHTYTAQTTANVISTAGDATLTASDPGHLTNGAYSLTDPLQVTLSKTTWTDPVSNDPVTVGFSQHIGANDPLRTGTYSRTLTFTLSTTQP